MLLADQRTATCLVRLREARVIADSLRHDRALHKVAMQAVFALEDCHESLIHVRDEQRKLGPGRRWSSTRQGGGST